MKEILEMIAFLSKQREFSFNCSQTTKTGKKEKTTKIGIRVKF